MDATTDKDGQGTLQYEGECDCWLHRGCAGVSHQLFRQVAEPDQKFVCPTCTSNQHEQQICELLIWGKVSDLAVEISSLKAIVIVIQKSAESKAITPAERSVVPAEHLVEKRAKGGEDGRKTGGSSKIKCRRVKVVGAR